MAFLEVKSLSMSRGGSRILSDVSLEVDRGEILAVIGHTGSGKTTLLRLIDLLDRPTAGRIILDRADLTYESEWARLLARRRMAMVFQKPVMFRSTVYDNVSYGLKVRGIKSRERVLEALKAVGMEEYRNRDATTLSGGEMQRVALARAMVVVPEVLLLDEPTANLDQRSAGGIDDLITGIAKRGAAVVIATHNLAQCIRLADRVEVLFEGRVTKSGSPEDVLKRDSTGYS